MTLIRYSTVIAGCTMAGLAGAALLLLDGIFQENLTQSAGFIAVALVYFGAWRPAGHDGVAPLRRGDGGGPPVEVARHDPTSAADLAATAPAVITVLALVALAGRFRAPASLGKAYVRGT